MNKELSLNERIQKLFESGWVNEFNYLENQLQEARYLLACLNEKYTQLINNWNELEKHLNHEIEEWQDVSDDWTKAQVQEDKIILERMKEIKEDNNVSSRN